MRLFRAYLMRLRTERMPAIAFVGLVAVTAFAAAATPRLLDRTADAALRTEVAAADAGSADIELIEEGRIDSLAAVAARGAAHDAAIPSTVESLVADRYFAVDTAFWSVLTQTPEASTIFLRIQQDVEPYIAFTEGRPPTDAVRRAVFTETQVDEEIDVLEAAFAAPAALELGVGVGDTVVLGHDPTDPLGAAIAQPMAIDVVGIFEAVDLADPYWSGDRELGESWIRSVGDDVQFRAAIGLLSPEAYQPLLNATGANHPPLRYHWRSIVDQRRLDAADAEALSTELRRMEGLFPATGTTSPLRGTLLRSGLLGLVERHLAGWRAVEAILAVVAIGAAAVGALAVILVAVLAIRRRRTGLATWVARGATSGQLAAATLGETVLLTAPAVVLASLAAVALVVANDRIGVLLAAGVGVAAVVVVVVTVVRIASAPIDQSGARVIRGPGARRLVIEAVVVVLAIGGAVLLRGRGVSSASSSGEVAIADPVIAAVPALAGLAAGLIAVRVVPIPLGGLASLAAVRRDLVPIMGLRRATREGTTAAVLIVLMMTALIASFSLATLGHVTAAGTATAWQDVGAAFRVTSTTGVVSDRLDPDALPGVEAAARSYFTPVATRGIRGFDLLAIDMPQYASVVDGTQLDGPIPAAMLGDAESPLPAIISTALIADVNGVSVGDEFGVAIQGHTVELLAIEARDMFPTLPVNGRFAIISLAQLESLDPDAALPTSTLALRAPDDAGPAIREALGAVSPSLRLESRAEETASFSTSPVIAAMVSILAGALAVVAAYAALAIAASLAMAGSARATEAAHLRALGLTRRQAVLLVIAEHGSTIVIGFVAGTLLGLWLFSVLQPGLGLASLIGSDLVIPLSIEAAYVALLFVAIAVIAAVGIGLSSMLERGSAPASAIRKGIE